MTLSRPLKIFLGAVAVLACGATFLVMNADNRRLRRLIASQTQANQQASRDQAESQRLQQLVARIESEPNHGAALANEVRQARAEVMALEQRAEQAYRQLNHQAAADTEALANSRNPEKALTRLEYFQNVGRATPSAAVQTFLWAAMKGADDVAAEIIFLDDDARREGTKVMETLSAAAREKYSQPEKVAALFFANTFTTYTAAQIAGVTNPTADQAMVELRNTSDKAQKIPLRLGPNGWQIIVPARLMERIGAWAKGKQ